MNSANCLRTFGRRRPHVKATFHGGHRPGGSDCLAKTQDRSEEHTSELQSLMRISYAVFCLKKKKTNTTQTKARNTLRRYYDKTIPKTQLRYRQVIQQHVKSTTIVYTDPLI